MWKNSSSSKKRFKAFSLIELSIVILIIGILITGIIGGISLLDKARLNTARTLTASSPVAGIPDIYLWVESTSQDSFIESETVDGQRISTWYDINPQSTQRRSLTQSTTAAKPFYKEKYRNGLPSVSFRFSNNRATLQSSNYPDTPQKFTIFAVSSLGSAGTTGNGFFLIYIKNAITLRYNNSSESNYNSTFIYDGSSFEPRAQISTSPKFNTVQLLTSTYDGTTLTIKRKDPISTTATASTTRRVYLQPEDSIVQIYQDIRDTGGSTVIGEVMEVIVFSRKLTDEEYSAVESYLNKKWQIY